MRLLHDSERYGYLSRDGRPVSDEQAARRCGLDLQSWAALVAELVEFDLLKRSADGILFSPELVAQAEWRTANAKRQKNFQDKKRGKTDGKNNGEYNGEYNADITTDITPESQPNFKRLKQPISSSNEKEIGGGGGRNGKPPPTAPTSSLKGTKSKTKQRLEELQAKYPDVNVEHVREKYLAYCSTSRKEPKWQIFEEWLRTEYEPMELPAGSEDAGAQEARRKAIADCGECDANGYVKVGDAVKICKHDKKGVKT